MNKGIEILLARMESNPDEFLTGNKSGKWLHLMESFEDHMLPEERKVLMDKYNALKMEKFTERVMKEVLEDQQEKSDQFGQAYAANLAASMQQNKSQISQQVLAAQARQNYITTAQANAMNQTTAGALGIGSAGQIYMSNGAGSIQPVSLPTTSTTEVRIGEQSLTEKTLKKLKALLK